MSEPLYVEVALNIPLQKTFHYAITPDLVDRIDIGKRVYVPFGSRKLVGVILSTTRSCDIAKLKNLIEVIDDVPVIHVDLLDLARWMSSYYLTGIGEVLFSMLPPDLKDPKNYYDDHLLKLKISIKDLDVWAKEHKRKKNQIKILNLLKERSPLSIKKLKEAASMTGFMRQLSGLMEKGLVAISDNVKMQREAPYALNDEQDLAIQSIQKNVEEETFHPYLLHGVTGSGKTEVYLQIVSKVLRKNKTALVMVPEIALTPQLFECFETRFRGDVAVLHSQLTMTQRQRHWWAIKNKEVRVVVGSRSAIFAPLQNIGVIVVDEEHETSYKQDDSPRYQGRDVAVMRANLVSAPVILGSATPSFESYYNTKQKKYTLLEMKNRAGAGTMPQTYLVDMRYDARKNFLFSRLLFEKVLACLQRKEQVILFLNRRGAAPALICESCGKSVMCVQCDVSLTYHSHGNNLRCHYCDFSRSVLKDCPSCYKPLKAVGVGSQRLEEETRSLFRDTRVARIDTDVAAKKGEVPRILKSFEAHEIDILVGTQMVAKGLDIHNVTLIGVVYADTGFFLPDFRAPERIFQLIHQVSGRAGRGNKKGEVVIQTYNADNTTLKHAIKGEYNAFFEKELADRRELFYAPFSRMVEILFRGPRNKDVQSLGQTYARVLRGSAKSDPRIYVLGPSPMPIVRVNQQYRWHLLLKIPKSLDAQVWLKDVQSQIKAFRGVKVLINIDPLNMI